MELDAKKLGAINLLQSTVHLSATPARMAEFLVQGLSAFPGTGSVAALIGDVFRENAIGGLPDERACRSFWVDYMGAAASGGTGSGLLADFKTTFGVECLMIQSPPQVYGCIIIDLSCQDTFALYRPYLENLLSITALVIETHRRQEQLRAHKAVLEQAVAQQTRELEKSRERFDLALDAVRDAVWDWQVDTDEVFFTPRWYTMLGYEPYELPQAYATWSGLLHPDDRQAADAVIRERLKKGKPFEIEFRMKTKDETWKWILARGRTVKKDAGGNPLRVVGTQMDITERKQLESHLQQAQKMEAIGTLAGGIAHDFNNILFPLLGFSELLNEDLPEDSPLQAYVREIKKAGIRARDLVAQILTFSRQSSHEDELFDIQPVVKEALKLLRATIPSTIRLNWEIDPDCGPIRANPTQVHQIVMNLVTNAFHATEKQGGHIRVTLKQAEDAAHSAYSPTQPVPGRFVRLTVSDDGTGIPPDLMPRIFDPYFTTKEQNRGTGLGLSVVQGIVKKAKGHIDIRSKPGKGTRVVVMLPIPDEMFMQSDTGQPEKIVGGKEHILLVDDEPAIVRMLEKMLKRMGYRVTACTNSVSALETARSKKGDISLLVTDMTMPEMTGLSLIEEIRTFAPDLPVMICTGFSSQVNDDAIRRLNIQGHLKKPVIRSELAGLIRGILDGRKKAGPPVPGPSFY